MMHWRGIDRVQLTVVFAATVFQLVIAFVNGHVSLVVYVGWALLPVAVSVLAHYTIKHIRFLIGENEHLLELNGDMIAELDASLERNAELLRILGNNS